MNTELRFHTQQQEYQWGSVADTELDALTLGDHENPDALSFTLENIDPKLIFYSLEEEDGVMPTSPTKQQEEVVSIQQAPPTFGEWMDHQASTPDSIVTTSELPLVFQQADAQAQITTQRLATIKPGQLKTIGALFGSLAGIIGTCGPFCVHSLGAVGNATSSLASGGPFAGLNMSGFSVDGNGRFSLSGKVGDLAEVLGVQTADLLSGAYSAQDILRQLFSALGDGITCICGFTLLEYMLGSLVDSFVPQH